jgi:hypothetical protein
VTTRSHFTFRVDIWIPDGESIVEHFAGVDDFEVAEATYRGCGALASGPDHAAAGRGSCIRAGSVVGRVRLGATS